MSVLSETICGNSLSTSWAITQTAEEELLFQLKVYPDSLLNLSRAPVIVLILVFNLSSE